MGFPAIDFCSFVKASDLFEGYDDLLDSWAETSDFTWGTNARTLVTFGSILAEMDDAGIDCPESFSQLIPHGVYVDLEN